MCCLKKPLYMKDKKINRYYQNSRIQINVSYIMLNKQTQLSWIKVMLKHICTGLMLFGSNLNNNHRALCVCVFKNDNSVKQ